MPLDILRRNETWFTRAILIVIAVTFIFGFGFIRSNLGFGRKVAQHSAAEVNGEGISLLDFYRARDRFRRQLQQSGAPEEILNSNFIGSTAINQLIDLKLLSQKAKELGFMVTDKELSESIKSDPAFQVGGRFVGSQGYRSFIERGLNESVSEFEKSYREQLLAQKLVNFMFETAKVTDEELFNIYKIRNEKVNLYFLSFSPKDFKASSLVSEEDIRSYYGKHKSEFKTPELRRIRYITVSPEDFENKVRVSEDEIKAYYEAHPDKFKPEKGIRPLSEMKDEIRAEIKKKGGKALLGEFAQTLKEQIRNKSLGEIAKKNGPIGINESGPFSSSAKPPDIPPQVVEKAFTIKQGENAFSRVEEKIYVIEIVEITPPKEKNLEEAQGEVREYLEFMRAKQVAEITAQNILKKIQTNGEGLEKVAKSFGLNLEETGYFPRLGTVPKIKSDEVKVDAFLLSDKNRTASRVYRVGDKFYIVSLKEKQDADSKEFKEKKAELKENELSQRRNQLYSDWVQELRQRSKIAINQSLFPPQG
jgi:peptidyl-prolyl cis-trans isomerase D